jgi:hypothetical protein
MKFVNRFSVSFLCPFFSGGHFLFSCGGIAGEGKGRGERAMMFYTTEQAVDGGFCQEPHVQLGMCTPGRIRRLHPAVMQEPVLKHCDLNITECTESACWVDSAAMKS